MTTLTKTTLPFAAAALLAATNASFAATVANPLSPPLRSLLQRPQGHN